MLDAVLANFVNSIEEREFDAPFMSLLRAEGFYDVHFTHGGYEFGKDFIGKRRDGDQLRQYVFQSKAGDLNLGDWNRIRGQIDLLRQNRLAHPSFDLALPRQAVLLTTGRLVGGAALAAQDYCQQLVERGEVTLDIWDRERLIELARTAVTIGLADRAEGPLFGIVAAIDDRTVTDHSLERFSQRWCPDGQFAWACALEAAVIATRLQRTGRLDLAAYVGLSLVRAACCHLHDTEPPDAEWAAGADLGRLIFATYAELLWQRRASAEDPVDMIRNHREPAALITHAVRCVRIFELLGLFGLMEAVEGHEHPPSAEIAAWLSRFSRRQAAAAYPISDRWAVSAIPPVLLLAQVGFREAAADHLRSLMLWIAQRYGQGTGLAAPTAAPHEEVKQVIGNVVPPRTTSIRSESYVATTLLDLAAFLRFDRLYTFARNEFRVLNALPCVLTTEDSEGQYLLDGVGISYEPNAPYSDAMTGNWTGVAPHLLLAVTPRYLQRIRRSWDHLAVSAVLRDRHFVSAWPNFSV